ncbi:MAG: YciI family protein [Gemmatales bacterium]|nr:YciI family protein [Gemmatales bacterium]MDW8385390.1 YciI family protein [Gemmatales bacterium]
MKFAAVIEYTTDKAKIAAIRPEHRQYLAKLKSEEKLAASGPFLDDSGALIIYEAGSREEAETLLQNDPFHREGIFIRWQLRPWNPVMANRALFPE